jgi:hypothetical protein
MNENWWRSIDNKIPELNDYFEKQWLLALPNWYKRDVLR